MKWETAKLGDVCQIGDGAHASLKRQKDGIPYLTAKNISKNGIDYSSLDYISEETYSRHFKEKSSALTKPRKNDILYSIIGSIGGVYIVGNEKVGISSSVAIFRCSEIIYPQYLYYYFNSDNFNMQIQSIKGGVAQGFMSLSKLSTIEIFFPDLSTQRRIAAILSAYDNLIENNQKQIKLLEEAAQRLYKEWFVDMRFPGHENVRMIDGVPEGWERVQLSQLISYEIGGGWGTEQPDGKSDKPAYVIRGTDFNGLNNGNIINIPFRYHEENNLRVRALQSGNIIFEVSGGSREEGVARTVRINQNLLDRLHKPVMCASFCKLIRPIRTDISQFLFDHFRYLRRSKITEEFDKRSASSIVNFRWKDFLLQQYVLIPNSYVLNQYNGIAESISEQITNLSLQIESLKNIRDSLLPKLMSGKIEV